MCLAIPKQIIRSRKGLFDVKTPSGKETLASLIRAKKGDWVLSQNNVIIKKISAEQAKEIKSLLKI